MDYTIRFRNNLLPGQVNFDKLEQLYGAFNNDDDEHVAVSAAENTTNPTMEATAPSALEQQMGQKIPDTVQEKLNDIVKCLETKSCSECTQGDSPADNSTHADGVRRNLRQKTESAEECEFSVGEHTVVTHKLLAQVH